MQQSVSQGAVLPVPPDGDHQLRLQRDQYYRSVRPREGHQASEVQQTVQVCSQFHESLSNLRERLLVCCGHLLQVSQSRTSIAGLVLLTGSPRIVITRRARRTAATSDCVLRANRCARRGYRSVAIRAPQPVTLPSSPEYKKRFVAICLCDSFESLFAL